MDAPTSIVNKPKVNLSYSILRSTSKEGTYTTVGVGSFGRVNYSSDYKLSTSRKTGHYKVVCKVTAESGGTVSMANDTVYWCINRTGHIWVFNYTDSKSKKKVKEPYTGYKKETLYLRPSNLNTKYKQWYDDKYGTNISLKNKEVHHIRPLAYGGNNAMSNLIHIQANPLHKGITAWWSGY